MCTIDTCLKVPAYVDTKLQGSPPSLRGLVPRSSVSQPEIEAFLALYAFSSDGKTEYVDGSREDDYLEFGRTVSRIGPPEFMLHDACIFAENLEDHFKGIEVSVL